MFSDIALGYNKNDFFYVTAEENGKMPSNNECQSIINDTDFDYQTICRTGNEEQRTVFNTGDNSAKCIQRELCVNKDKVSKVESIQNNHSGSEEKYNDYKKVFRSTQLDTLNLGVGIVGLIFFIYRARNINV